MFMNFIPVVVTVRSGNLCMFYLIIHWSDWKTVFHVCSISSGEQMLWG